MKQILLHLLLAGLLFSCKPYEPTKSDWTRYRKNNYLNSVSDTDLDASRLSVDWVKISTQEPTTAWHGPAKEDTYRNNHVPLPAMRNYDPVFQPIVVNQKLYFNSSADDAIHCLDIETGKELWIFNANAPVRIAPTYYNGNLLFGSDDGYVYSIDADDGDFNWKFSPSPKDHNLIFNAGRLSSFWPIRTGVLVENGIAYFAASMLTWKTTYFCAIDAETGKTKKEGTYIKEFKNQTFEAPFAAVDDKFIVPRGRIAPLFINKTDGKILGSVPNSVGCFILITDDNKIAGLSGTRAKSVGISDFPDKNQKDKKKKPKLINYPNGKSLAVMGETVFILADNSISAYNRKTKNTLWVNEKYKALSLLVSGNTLYAGSHHKFYAINPNTGETINEIEVKGAVYDMITARNSLFISTDLGNIYKFSSKGDINAYTENTSVISKDSLTLGNKPVKNHQILFPDKYSAEIFWETEEECQTIIKFSESHNNKIRTLSEKTLTKKHSIKIENLKKKYKYNYQILVNGKPSRIFFFDNTFNYANIKVKNREFPINISDKDKNAAKKFINGLRFKSGYLAFEGVKSISIALEIIKNSTYNTFIFEKNKYKVDKYRKILTEEGIYGGRISIVHTPDYQNLPVPSNSFNACYISDNKNTESFNRITQPKGFVYMSENSEFPIIHTQSEIEGAGDWTHQYGNADNSSYGGEKSFWGCSESTDFEAVWLGKPGPRYIIDRNGRKNAPLYKNGVLVVQAEEKIVALNAYNGTLLWSTFIPDLLRVNMPRDCGNWTIDDDYLYTAINDEILYKIDILTGKIVKTFKASDYITESNKKYWGFVSNQNNILVGSSVHPKSQYTDFYGGGNDGWYDATRGKATYKVLSDELFVLDKEGKKFWNYKGGKIINSTISINNYNITFAESSSAKVNKSNNFRGDLSVFNNMKLISLNLLTGEKNWSKKLITEPGEVSYYSLDYEDKLAIVASVKNKFHTYVFNNKNGERIWYKEKKWSASHHGAHMSKPAILKGHIIVKPYMMNLNTGEDYKWIVPKTGHGCGSQACSEQSAFYRGGSICIWNGDANEYSKWERLRSGCWLSTIPAGGMLLSPEASGGCSCGNWLETSIVFAPKSRVPILIHSEKGKVFKDNNVVSLKLKPGISGEIRYTIDGTEPIETSPIYANPFVIYETTTIKAKLFKNNKYSGQIRQKEYIKG